MIVCELLAPVDVVERTIRVDSLRIIQFTTQTDLTNLHNDVNWHADTDNGQHHRGGGLDDHVPFAFTEDIYVMLQSKPIHAVYLYAIV